MANHLKQDRVDRVNIRTYSCPSPPPTMWTIIFLCVFQSWMLEGSFLIDRVCLVLWSHLYSGKQITILSNSAWPDASLQMMVESPLREEKDIPCQSQV